MFTQDQDVDDEDDELSTIQLDQKISLIFVPLRWTPSSVPSLSEASWKKRGTTTCVTNPLIGLALLSVQTIINPTKHISASNMIIDDSQNQHCIAIESVKIIVVILIFSLFLFAYMHAWLMRILI